MTKMSLIFLFFLTAVGCSSAPSQSQVAAIDTPHFCTKPDRSSVAWADQNIHGFAGIGADDRLPIYCIVDLFFGRLVHWQDYKFFYDKMYEENKAFKKQHPFYIDPKEGLFLAILLPGEKLTDLGAYRTLKRKTVGEVLGYAGDKRLFDEIVGDGARQTLITMNLVTFFT